MVQSVSALLSQHGKTAHLPNDNESSNEQLREYITSLQAEKSVLERYRIIQRTVGEIVAEARTLDEDILRIISAICRHIGWDFAELWRVEDHSNVLVCNTSWYNDAISLREFDRITRQITFSPGVGLPGRIWDSMQPAWIPDVVQDNNFLRAPVAAREGLHTGFGIPIRARQKTIGVLSFFSTQVKQLDNDLLHILEDIMPQVGLFIERKQQEKAEFERTQNNLITGERQSIAEALQARTTSTLLVASVTASAIPYLWDYDHTKLWQFLQELQRLTHTSLEQAHDLLRELGTGSTKQFTDMLQGLVKQISAPAHLNVTFNVKGELELNTHLQVALYLITQEALQNIVQHAYAPQASVGLFGSDEGGELQITDNGRGFDTHQVFHKRLGLQIIRQCAERIGGQLEITSKVGDGTRISLYWRNLM